MYKNTGSVARDHLALERTFLAWLRTGLGFIALGIAIERFSQLDIGALLEHVRPSESIGANRNTTVSQNKGREHLLPATLLSTGSGSIAYGTSRYFLTMRLLEQGLYKPAYHGAAVLSVAVAGVAGATYWYSLRNYSTSNRQSRDGVD